MANGNNSFPSLQITPGAGFSPSPGSSRAPFSFGNLLSNGPNVLGGIGIDPPFTFPGRRSASPPVNPILRFGAGAGGFFRGPQAAAPFSFGNAPTTGIDPRTIPGRAVLRKFGLDGAQRGRPGQAQRRTPGRASTQARPSPQQQATQAQAAQQALQPFLDFRRQLFNNQLPNNINLPFDPRSSAPIAAGTFSGENANISEPVDQMIRSFFNSPINRLRIALSQGLL